MNTIKTIKIQPDVLFQEVRGETVLLNLDNESYFGLDETGTFFWKLLQENNDFQKVFDIMLDEYDVDAVQLKTDLDSLVEKMVEAGLINISTED
jgi:hypothetical protein